MRLRATAARATSAALALLCAGCYRYVPLPPGAAPAAGAEVRYHLTPEGTSRVAPALGPQTTVVAGRVDPGAGDGMRDGMRDGVRLLVSSTTKAYGATVQWVGERVTIPAGAVARGEQRVLDRRRTLLVGGGVTLAAAAGYAILRAVSGGGGGAGADPPTPTP